MMDSFDASVTWQLWDYDANLHYRITVVEEIVVVMAYNRFCIVLLVRACAC